MSRLLLLFLLLHTVFAIESCVIQQQKGKPDIQVIQLDDFSEESGEPEIVALHLPDRGRREVAKQARGAFCRKDENCRSGMICLAHFICVQGIRRTPDSLGPHVTN